MREMMLKPEIPEMCRNEIRDFVIDNKPPKDSRKDLVDYLIDRGLSVEKILDLCRAVKSKKSAPATEAK